MKQHIRLKLKQAIEGRNFPHWQDILRDQSIIAPAQIYPQIDEVLNEFKLTVRVTREYQPAGRSWDRTEKRIGLNRVYRLILKNNVTIPQKLIQKIARVSIVEEVYIGQIGETPLPNLLPTRKTAQTDTESRQAIYLDIAHQYSQGDKRITVAVLDTGVDLSHPELQEVLVPGFDFVNIIDGAGKFVGDFLDYDENPDDEVGHGTHVAGIIAGKGINIPPGVVPNCKVLPVRVLGAMQRGNKRVGAGLVDNINSGIKWAIDQGADVINMSLGIEHQGGGLPHQEVVEYAQSKGVTIVAASGNDGQEKLYYPGALPYVIAVGAVDKEDQMAYFSTYGRQVDFVAPGVDIYSTYVKDDYAFSTGTSHASPFVAGGIALLKSYALQKTGQKLSDSQVKYLLKHSSDKIDTHFKHRKAGFGRLNLQDALRLLDYKLG